MNNYSKIMEKSKDIYLLMIKINKIGWDAIKKSSINRVIYLSAILYTFRYPEDDNIFEDRYNFSVNISGPEDADIEKALINLESNEVITHTEEGYALSGNNKEVITTEETEKLENWFEDIAYIIGRYGEERIYDFIFRDPEYRNSYKSNSPYNLNISNQNDTVAFLNTFKKAFEDKIVDDKEVLTNREYLEMYFEYVFGKILRGEN